MSTMLRGFDVLHVDCDCGLMDHHIRFLFENEERHNLIYLQYYLEHRYPWYKRIAVAFKYIFKIGRMDTDFQDVVISKEDAVRIRDAFDKWLEASE